MDADKADALIDKIYEASILTGQWASVIDDLSHVAECEQGILFSANAGGLTGYICNPAMKEAARIYFEEEWGPRDALTARAITHREAHFITTDDLFPNGEIEDTEYFRDYMVPLDQRWVVGTVMTSASEDMLALAFHRSAKGGPITRETADRLTALRPFIARSSFISARLQLQQAEAALQALKSLGLPACAVNKRGQLALSNELFGSLVTSVVEDRRERLRFVSKAADSAYQSEIERWKDFERGRTGKSFPVKAQQGDLPYIVHVVPVSGDARDIFSAGHWLLIFVPVALAEEMDVALLRGLFDLTTSEAAIAGGIVTGKTLQQLGQERGSSVETIRTQLKSIMTKTGTNRQAELVSLLANTRGLPQSR